MSDEKFESPYKAAALKAHAEDALRKHREQRSSKDSPCRHHLACEDCFSASFVRTLKASHDAALAELQRTGSDPHEPCASHVSAAQEANNQAADAWEAIKIAFLAAVHRGDACPFCLARTDNVWPFCVHFKVCVVPTLPGFDADANTFQADPCAPAAEATHLLEQCEEDAKKMAKAGIPFPKTIKEADDALYGASPNASPTREEALAWAVESPFPEDTSVTVTIKGVRHHFWRHEAEQAIEALRAALGTAGSSSLDPMARVKALVSQLTNFIAESSDQECPFCDEHPDEHGVVLDEDDEEHPCPFGLLEELVYGAPGQFTSPAKEKP